MLPSDAVKERFKFKDVSNFHSFSSKQMVSCGRENDDNRNSKLLAGIWLSSFEDPRQQPPHPFDALTWCPLHRPRLSTDLG